MAASKRSNPAKQQTIRYNEVENARMTGYGMIQPGAHPERESLVTPAEKVGRVVKRAGDFLNNWMNKTKPNKAK